MRELFVWYRVPTGRATPALACALDLQQTLRDRIAGLTARLLVRRDEASASETWMELYARPGTPAGVDAATESAIESAAVVLAPFVDGDRHAEAFVDPVSEEPRA